MSEQKEETVTIPLKEYQDLTNMIPPSIYQLALSEVMQMASRAGSVGEITDGILDILNRRQIHVIKR
ncbi:MAG TPA: hypothetical protein VGM30_14960 [Puia sp.]|jgi:hypothetical protein